MSKDKTVLVLLITIAVASFCGGMFLLEKIEKNGLFQGQSTWQYLNKRFRALLAEDEKRKQSNPESRVIHARLLHNVGITCGYTDQWADAIKTLNQCVDFKLKDKSVSPESLIQSIESLGKAYFLAGQYNNALIVLEMAQRDWMHERGPDSFHVARCMNCIGRVNLAMGNHKTAEKCFEKAKLIFKKEDDRAATAKTYLLLSVSSLERGDFQKALQQLDETIPLLKVDLGENYRSYFNDDVACLKCVEGQLLVLGAKSNAGKIDEGIQLIKEGAEQTYISFGKDDVYTQKFRLALADAYMRKGDANSCLSELQQIENSFERIGLPHHPFLKRVYELHLKAQGDSASSLTDVVKAKLKDVQYVASQAVLDEAGRLGTKLNTAPKNFSDRRYIDPWMFPLTFLIVSWAFSGMFACSLACAARAGRKGYVGSVWFILGVVFNLAAYLVISALPSRNTLTDEFGVDFSLIDDARSGVFLLSLAPLFTILGASIFYYPAPVRDVFIALFLASCVCLILFPPIWCFAIAKSKGRNRFLWALIGFFSSVFGLIFLLLLKPGDNAEVDEEETRNSQSEATMLVVSAIHIALFLGIVANICHSWMLHVEL